MAFSDEELDRIYERTAGRCHVCRKKLAWKNYGLLGAHGAWEVDHSKARARGGTNRLNNLYAACVRCNRGKGARTTQSARARHGYRSAPLSAEVSAGRRRKNMIGGALAGAGLGSLAGPGGAAVGALFGAMIGGEVDPEPD